MSIVFEQCLNGIQFGLLLFLLAAGLTLVFGIMELVNLAHGSLYMIGAYLAATAAAKSGSFGTGLASGLLGVLALGMLLELLVMKSLYGRSHLDHVLATFGLILFFNESVRLIWGPGGMTLAAPEILSGSFKLGAGFAYPVYRLAIIATGLLVALFLYVLVQHTRIGMLIRAGATNRKIVAALGVNIDLLFTIVFGLGACLAALGGVMAAPILTIQIGMGENVLILALVVIVIGGIGSVRGAFFASLLVGLIDTMGRAFLPELFRIGLSPAAASTAAPAISSMLIYLLMAFFLVIKPEGLFPAPGARQ